jgi:Tfp pilus assembly protein PilF
MRNAALLALVLFVALLSGCTTTARQRPVTRGELQALMRSRDVEAPEIVVPYRITPEMKEWAMARVPATVIGEEKKIYHLSAALFDPAEFGLEYEKTPTSTAVEVFQTRKANCLAFTHLFVGMARGLDVEAFFVEVRDVETYVKEGDLIVVSDHVAVGYGPGHDIKVIDFALQPEETQYGRVSRITDHRAIAMYYSNRGAEFLRTGDYEDARSWLLSAVTIDPGYASSWVNYGVSLRRNGDLEGAEKAYRNALELDLHSSSALQNLSALLYARGENAEALELLALADRSGNRNPYTYLTLGDLSMRHGKMDEAGRFYRKALRRRSDSAEPLAAMGAWELEQGGKRKARRLLEKAEEIDPQSVRVAMLKSSLGPNGG